MQFFASTAIGLELLLVEELKQLGAISAAEKLAGVAFSGDLRCAYRACLWSRLANRILLPLMSFPASDAQSLYSGVKKIDWSKHFSATETIHVNFISSQSQLNHTQFGAQKTKDAIVDQFRERYGQRPNVAKHHPDIAIHVYVYRDKATVSLDLSGESLHKRSYRLAKGPAPLKENLAAGILMRSGYAAIAQQGGTLLDPMCGSGTFLIEGALIAADIAPGLYRSYFGFLKWQQHDSLLWNQLRMEAETRREQGLKQLPLIEGYDSNTHAIHDAFQNIERAGLQRKVHVEKRDIQAFKPKANAKTGLVVVNPPYGERMGEIQSLKTLYAQLGSQLKTNFKGWQATVFTGNPELGKEMGIRAYKYYAFMNGKIPCKLLKFAVEEKYFVDDPSKKL